MTRQKVKMAYIENESTRKSTFKKRKRGLLKKAHELATLCDVPVGVIIESPLEPNRVVWPSRETMMNKVVSEWKKMSAIDKTKKMFNQVSFLQQRIAKSTESLKKVWKENKEFEMEEVMFDCLNGKTLVSRVVKSDLRDFRCVIEQYLKDLNRRIEILKEKDESSSSYVAATMTSSAMPMLGLGSSSVALYERVRENIENNLKMKQTNKDLDLDLNQKQW